MLAKDILKPRAIEMKLNDPTRSTISIAAELEIGDSTVRRWFDEYRKETGQKIGHKRKKKPADFPKQVADLEPESPARLGSATQDEIDDFTACIKDILETEWSVKYLEENNVPMKLISELLSQSVELRANKAWQYELNGKPYAYSTRAVTYSYLILLFRTYREIPIDTAQGLTVRYVFAIMYEDDAAKKKAEIESVKTYLRFEPWRNKELAKAYREYVKNFAGRM
jgi:transposase